MTTTSLPSGITPVLSRDADRRYSGAPGDYMDISHRKALELKSGTISLSFSLDQLYGDMALISKDLSGYGAGQFSVWIKDGTINVYQDSKDGYEHIKIPGVVLAAGETYQFALSFGGRGLEVWLNGQLVGAEPTFKQGIANNDAPLVIGATRSWRSDPRDEAHNLFKGSIGDVQIYDRQLGETDMVRLAEAVDPALGMSARMAQKMADLMPGFEQMHSASDTFKEIAADYGIAEHGHMMRSLTMKRGGNGASTMNGGTGDDGLDGAKGNDTLDGKGGNDILQGGYGNDLLRGSAGHDILDGGHGEDILLGGAGNDLLISRADAREPKIAYVKGRDEGDPMKELTRGKLYPDQPIPGDDALTGGDGADIFYFQTLINAKKRYIEKHTNDDGTVNWHGVAGENDKLHDHWVDHIGNDVVMDYSRAEGDRLVIEGHTTRIWSISYSDANGDGVMDRSVIRLYSEQGSGGGAHNQDRLGSITVYGDLVKHSDIETTSAPAYGIVATTADISEAIKPGQISKDRGNIKAPKALPDVAGTEAANGLDAVLAIPTAHTFDGNSKNALIFDHSDALAIKSGTVALNYTTGSTVAYGTLFSKDAADYGTGGHLTTYVEDDGDIVVRLQSRAASCWLVARDILEADSTYDLAVSFGKGGLALYVDGVKIAYDATLTQKLHTNAEALIVGASGANNTPGRTDSVHSGLHGTIGEFAVYDRQLTMRALYGNQTADGLKRFEGSVEDYRFSTDDNGKLVVKGGGETTTIYGKVRFLDFDDLTVRPEDVHLGDGKDEELRGSSASEILVAGKGNDTVYADSHDDFIDGGEGSDRLYAGAGDDLVLGGDDSDYIDAGSGDDIAKGGLGNDEIKGGEGNDLLYGGLGDDAIFGNSWGTGGARSEKDTAVFDGNFADYLITAETYYNSTRGANEQRLVVTDSYNGGLDTFYEGRDLLYDIDRLKFADQTVLVDDIV